VEVVHPRCAGLDVHQKTVVACARVVEGRTFRQEVKTFATTTAGLLQLSDWLSSQGCTHVVMESTGIYWKPVWYVLEGAFELLLANAGHVRNVPGRKTDVNDAMWLADLLAHGLIQGSFVPPTPIQEARDLTRTRTQLTREIAQHTQRIQKTLEQANIKLTEVLTHVLGATGRAILEALIAGQTDPDGLVQLRRGKLKASPDELRDALDGRVRDHHRFLLRLHLDQIDALEKAVQNIERRLEVVLAPFRSQLDLLMTIPGVSRATAFILLAEIGADMSHFPSSAHLVSWAGLCPRSDQSAGKHRSTRLRPGDTWLKTALVQSAWAASRKKESYLRAQYYRLKARRGGKKAVIAVAASMLTAAYYILLRDVPYQDLGPTFPDRQHKEATARRLIARLRHLGLEVEIKSAA
jgi:transposase